MSKQKNYIVALAAVTICVCVIFKGTPAKAAQGVEKTSDGIMLPTEQGTLNLAVRTEDVIHVMVAKDRSFFTHASLSALSGNRSPKWELTTDEHSATIATAHMKALVDLKSGAISFQDSNGKVILAEKRNGRTLEPTDVQGEKTFHVRQQWQADTNESLYGLGQFQLGLVDIKNWDLDLWQHNGTVISPFLVSSKGYGILWDNPSFTRFGDLGSFSPIPPQNLIDETGKAGGLSTGPFTNTTAPLTTPTTSPSIGVAARTGRGGGGNRQRARQPGGTRWEGKLAPTITGDYQFQTYSNGTIKVWIDKKLVIDHFRQSWLPWYDVARVHLEAGQQYPIQVEWSSDGQGNQFTMAWKPPVADRDAQGTSLWSDVGGGVDYYFCYGPSIDKVISGFRNVTGRANMLPNWAMGYWQSRDHYSTQQQSIDAVAEFRKRQIPLDNIVQDWQYWPGATLQTVGSGAFDPVRYPDPTAWTKAIHDMHAHLMISVWGWVSSQSMPNDNYQAMLSKNYLLAAHSGPEARTFADFFNPEAGKFFWQQMNAQLYSKGMDAWWLDASEPDITGVPTLDVMRNLMNPNGMGTGAKVLNGYPLMESKAVYEGQRGVSPNQRVFILTRSGYPGMQRYSAAVWSGDTTSTWPAMRNQVMAGVGYSISGMPYWSMDIGGYQPPDRLINRRTPQDNDEWDELNTRWFEFGTFVPLMRVHGQGAREIYNFGPHAIEVMTHYDQLRYVLMPYIYSLAGDVTQNDGTIMRPLVMDFPDDSAAREATDEYMFGPAFLISPVYTYKARTRSVYLPKSTGWYDFWTGVANQPGTTIDATAPLESMPIFVKAGSIIPTGPVMQYVGEHAADPITLYIYTGANAEFSVYEDQGNDYSYEKGAFARIPFTWDDVGKTLTIGARQGSFSGMQNARTFNVIFVSKENPVEFAFTAKPTATVKYTGDKIVVKP